MSKNRSEGHKTHGKPNTDLLDSKYFILHLFFQFLEFFKSNVTCGALFFMHSIAKTDDVVHRSQSSMTAILKMF